MKLLAPLCLCVALFAGATAHAECDRDGLRLFPSPGSIIPTNSRFLLEGFGAQQAPVVALTNKTLTLQSADGDQVPVQVQRGWTSNVNRVAVVLRPLRELRPSKEYQLVLPGKLHNAKLVNQVSDKGASWRTGRSRDDRAPSWEERPSVSEGEYSFRGRELSRYIKLRMAINEDSPAFLVLTMRRVRGAVSKQEYFVPINGSEAVIGHDSCSGSFAFEEGGSYKARVELFDAAGNHSNVAADVEFLAPTAANQ